ncbi:MAG: hypothetical protein ILO68_02180, partial [Clostridia bacterium]|nr:hypothetical protein [Clostridia bacterium]
TRNWSPERSPELLDALLRSPLNTNSSLYSGLRDLASTLGTDAEYRFCREHIRSVREEGGVPSDDAFGDLLRCASRKADFGPEDGEDAELLRTAVRNRNTPEALRTYQRALASTGREDPAEAVEILLLLNDPDAAEEGVTRTADLFDRLTVGQIENAFPFWRGLVVFSDEDNQMKERFRYIDEDVALGADLKTLAAKMLLSDIYNPLYLKDSLNRSMPFSEYARKKLHYFEYVTYVRRNGTANVKTADAVRNYMKDGEYGLAIGLLKEIVGLPASISYTWGQLLGDLYTPETLRACGELTDMVPDVFRWIERMNRSDTNGAWKNTQRAVEIAEMTGTEPSLYETLGQSITRNFSGVAAAVIAELIPKGRLKEAETWLSDALASNPNHSYLKLTEAVLNTARKEGVLSDEDRYLLRTIPSTGNLRTLESYGELVFDACCEGDQTALIGALYRIYSEFEKGQADRALLVALMALSADAEEESVLYGRIREYALSLLSTDAEPDERKAAALAFAAAGVCLNQPEIDDLGTVFPLFDSQGGDREFINQLRSFRRYCDMHLQNGGDRRLLMRTALGRFSAGSLQMDARLIGIIFKVRQTPLLYTCCCAVSDGTVGEKEAYDFLVRAGYGPKSRVVEVLKEIDPGDAPLMRKLSHLPIEVPYVNFHIFRLILEQSTGRESMTALLMFFFAASSYVRDDYRKNLYGFEYLVNSGVRTGKL